MRSRHADHMSIFGDTYEGVVSPLVPHTHPWPTRFHGPNYLVPRFGKPYRRQVWNGTPQYWHGEVIGTASNSTDPFGVVKPLMGTGAVDSSKLILPVVAAVAAGAVLITYLVTR